MKITLRSWINENGLRLSGEDLEFASEILDDIGTVVECDDSATDWGFWCGGGVMVETNPTGTRIVHTGHYSVTTKIGYYDLKLLHGGMSPEDAATYINGCDWPVYAVCDS